MIKSVLIPTDGSAYSKVALEYGIYLAEKFGAQITGLHVVDERDLEGPLLSDIAGSLGFTPYQNYLPKFRKTLENRGDLILEAFRNSCEQKSIRKKVKRVSGTVPGTISEEAKKADLVIIAQRGEHERWSSGLLGSTTEAVVRRSPRPVLVTPASFREVGSVLVAYDGSVASNQALKTTCELFAYSNTRLTSVVVTGDAKKCEAFTEEIEAFVSPYQMDVEIECLEGETAKEILRYAALDCLLRLRFRDPTRPPLVGDGRAPLPGVRETQQDRACQTKRGRVSEKAQRTPGVHPPGGKPPPSRVYPAYSSAKQISTLLA